MSYQKPEHYPKVPTNGWMRSELDRQGKPVRGKPLTDAQLVAMLRELGYDVYESSTDTAKNGGKHGR